MTVKAKLNPGLVGGNRADSLNKYAAILIERPRNVMAVVELTPVDKVVPVDASSEKDAVLRIAIEQLHIAAPGEQDDVLRTVAQALHLSATANGTITEDLDVQYVEQTLKMAGDLTQGHEVARLRIILDWVLNQVEKICANTKHRDVDRKRLLGELVTKATGARDAGVQLDTGSS